MFVRKSTTGSTMNSSKRNKTVLSVPGQGWLSVRERWLTPEVESPKTLRKIMAWIFLLACLQYMVALVESFLSPTSQVRLSLSLQSMLSAPVFFVVLALVCGMAWWSIWKRKSTGRAWGVAASLAEVLMFCRQFVVYVPPGWGRYAGALVVGIVGLVAFFHPEPMERTPNFSTPRQVSR